MRCDFALTNYKSFYCCWQHSKGNFYLIQLFYDGKNTQQKVGKKGETCALVKNYFASNMSLTNGLHHESNLATHLHLHQLLRFATS